MMLTWAPLVHALPPGGGASGGVTPVGAPALPCRVNAKLSANPPSIDRHTSPEVSTLTWSIRPEGCPEEFILTLAGQQVDPSGSMLLDVPETRTFNLKAISYPGQPILASVTVTVPACSRSPLGPPLRMRIAPVQCRWMPLYHQDLALARARGNLSTQNSVIVWEVRAHGGDGAHVRPDPRHTIPRPPQKIHRVCASVSGRLSPGPYPARRGLHLR